MSTGTFLFLLFFLVAGLGIIAFSYWIWAKAAQSRTWPTTAGRVLSLELDDSMDTDGSATTYQTNVKYAYTVRGVEYVSTRIAYGYSASASRQIQLDIFKKLKEAPVLVVHYNPRQPSDCTLDTRTSPTAGRLFVGGIIWVAFTIGVSILQFLSATKDAHQ